MLTTERTGASSLLDLIGNTPLLRLSSLERDTPGVEIYAKAEWQNPGGSVKDRAAARMVCAGAPLLAAGRVLLDATSGNTGIAYAMLGAAQRFKVELCLPDNLTAERKRILRSYGATLVLTDPLESSDGAIREARRRFDRAPGRYYYPDQYNNPLNWRAHYETTGAEILAQTGGRVTHFVAGLGTSGTFTGVSRRLREYNPDIRLVSVQPDSPFHGLEGLKHMETAIVPGIYDPTLADEAVQAATESSYAMVRRLGREEGLLVGISSGAAALACLEVASRAPRGSVIVTVFPDGAAKYLSERFWEELD
jgi:S-sulfo-L-cysteine synthase (O-acetyl-L-serine-dependent)